MRRLLRAEIDAFAGGLPATYWWLWAGMLVNRLGSFVGPFLGVWLHEQRGATVAEAGGLVALFGLGSVLSANIGGVVADRVGRRAAMLLGLGLFGAGTIALGFVERLEVLAPFTLALGACSEIFRPGMQAAVADLLPDPAARTRAYGLLYWAANLGVAGALSIAGWLAQEAGFTLLFVGDGLTTLAFAAAVFLRVPETRPAAAARDAPRALAGLVAVFADRVFIVFLLTHLALAIVFFQWSFALPVGMREKGLSTGAVGSLMALNGAIIAVLQPLAARRIAGLDPSRVLSAAAVLSGLGYGLTALAETAPVFALSVAVWTLGEIGTFPVSTALVAQLAPASLRGRYQGAYTMTFGIALTLSPLVGAGVMERLGTGVLWTGCLAVGLLVAAAHLAARPSRQRRLAAARDLSPW